MKKAPIALSVVLAASLASFAPAAAWATEGVDAATVDRLAEAAVEAGEHAGGSAVVPDDADGATLLANNEAASLFIDADSSQWYAKDGWLDYVVDNALIKGYSEGVYAGYFGPNDHITRGQVATILWRIAGEPQADADAPGFTDLAAGAYYVDAVLWASGEGVVTGRTTPEGTPTGIFDPDGDVTREELATMMGRYAAYVAGLDVDEGYESAAFGRMPDASTVSEFARGWMAWCYDEAILRGNDQTNTLNPKSNATRAEMAKMTTVLHRDVLGLPEVGTTQVERETAFLTSMKHGFDEAFAEFEAYGFSHDVYLMPASSGLQHAYWIDITFPMSSSELEALIVGSDGFAATWANLKTSLAESSRVLYDAGQAALVDLPVNICVRDNGGEIVLMARNGAITATIA